VVFYNETVGQIRNSVLIVEDEESMLQALVDAFTSSGFIVEKAKNGEEGIKVALQKHPGIILLDILMPKMDGLALLRKLRADLWGKEVPVVMLTNVNPESNTLIQEVLEQKPAYYLIKSNVTLEGIVDKVKEVLGM
jgi:DNA-binding response OmpR family regulator